MPANGFGEGASSSEKLLEGERARGEWLCERMHGCMYTGIFRISTLSVGFCLLSVPLTANDDVPELNKDSKCKLHEFHLSID